jgi:hypothetical protein
VLGREAGSGVSSIQLLKEANEQRIPIHVITSANYDAIAPRLNLNADVEVEIANAVQVGKQVVVSERAPIHGNWKGVGYIIEDPQTGAAAYLIRGGLNGGSDDPCDGERQKEPVRVPVIEILFVVLIIIAIILLLMLLPELIAGLGAALGAAGQVIARLAAIAGVGAFASPAMAQGAPAPRPGDGLPIPGDCSWAQYMPLRDAVDAYCHGAPSCRPYPIRGADCTGLRAAKDRNVNCALARTTLNTTCFRGGDQVHWNEEVIAWERVYLCECRMASNGCPP